jgi:TRAP-type C4-dicarboxylate transport system substrate-binding protein
MLCRLSVILVIFLLSLVAAQTTIKFATLAPEGTTSMNIMQEYVKAVQDETKGEVKFKIYPGGVSGDEKDMLRKIRIGQLHSAGFTGVGLGEILPEIRILDAPFLFHNYQEVDHVTSKLFDYFAQKFEQQGYILLGWAEVGFVYVFSNEPIHSFKDIIGIKMWMWAGDPIAEATFKALRLNPIPLSITDVLTSLQTNLINGVYVAPYYCMALQWHTKIKYMLQLPLADSNGAVLLDKRIFNKLSEAQRSILKTLSLKYFDKLTRLSREDNEKSLELIKATGITFTSITDQEELAKFYQAGKDARRDLLGKLFSRELLEEVELSLETFRSSESEIKAPASLKIR